jgi:hypothetical protein
MYNRGRDTSVDHFREEWGHWSKTSKIEEHKYKVEEANGTEERNGNTKGTEISRGKK